MAKKILLADDSITIQKVIELTFSDEDFDVITVGNGRLAIERLAEARPDIVLCDIIMPEKDGYEVCEHVKSNPASSHVPVLLLTGAFEPFDQERATRAGYDGSLAKPFEPETLIAKVKELLARAPARAAAPASAPVPTVVPFARPSATSTPPAAPLGAGFIPDEPFPERPEPAPAPAAPAAPPPLAELSDEESATLAVPPGSTDAEDSASTVMFRAGDLGWKPGDAPPLARVSPPPRSEPEPALVPDAPAPLVDALAEDAPVFEAVLEEDLDFGPGGFEPETTSDQSGETLFAPEPAVEPSGPAEPTVVAEPVAAAEPPVVEPPAPVEESPSGGSSLDDLVSSQPLASEPAFVEESLQSEPEPPVAAEPEPAVAEPAYGGTRLTEPPPEPPVAPPAPAVPQPPAWASGVPAATEELPPPPALAAEPDRPTEAATPTVEAEAPATADEVAAGPLADLAVPAETPAAPPPSQAGALSVPVDMVEKIAQRVVAQVSEKVVREIAWEVVPDLAEALIKQEIERLKAELQKT